MPDFALSSSPMQSEAPGGTLITDWQDMVGKTIRYVEEAPNPPTGGKWCSLVIVFEDDCWAGIEVTGDDDDADVDLARVRYGTPGPTAAQFMSPRQLLVSGLINRGQHDYMLAQIEANKQKAEAEKLAALQAQVASLEASIKAAAAIAPREVSP